MEVVDTGNAHLFGFLRRADRQQVLVVNNFSPHPRSMASERLQACGCDTRTVDLISGVARQAGAELALEPYGFVWLDCSRT